MTKTTSHEAEIRDRVLEFLAAGPLDKSELIEHVTVSLTSIAVDSKTVARVLERLLDRFVVIENPRGRIELHR